MTGLLLVAMGHAQSRPRLLSEVELTASRPEIVGSVIPDFAGDLTIEAAQSFVVAGGMGTTIRLVPVRYSANNARSGNTGMRCGVFVLREKLPASFVPTVGYDWLETEACGAVDALGFLPGASDGFPRVLLVYTTGTAHSEAKEPVVLDFSTRANTYKGNEKLSRMLASSGEKVTIARMKQAIAAAGTKAR